MNTELFLAALLLLNLFISLFFVLQTRSHSSKMLITLLFSTTGAAVLLLLYSSNPALRGLLDAALVFLLLSAVTAIIFAKRLHFIKRT